MESQTKPAQHSSRAEAAAVLGIFGLSGALAVLLLGWDIGVPVVAVVATLVLAGITGCRVYGWSPWSDWPLPVLSVFVFLTLLTVVAVGLLGYTAWSFIALASTSGNWMLLLPAFFLVGLLAPFLLAIRLIVTD